MSMTRHIGRAGALLLTTAAVLLGAAAPSSAATTDDPAEAGAGWLESKLADGDHLEVEFDGQSFPDYGLTADAVLAFDSARVAQDAAGRATDYLAANVGAYAGDGTTESYAGPLAKLINVSAAQGADPTSFGGRNLVDDLTALECGSVHRTDCEAEDTGRFSDKSAFGNFSNGIGQSLALIGLKRATTTGPSAAAITFLVEQQCDDGGFPETFHPDTCTSSIDTTGFVAQALLYAGGPAGTGSRTGRDRLPEVGAERRRVVHRQRQRQHQHDCPRRAGARGGRRVDRSSDRLHRLPAVRLRRPEGRPRKDRVRRERRWRRRAGEHPGGAGTGGGADRRRHQ